MQREQIIKRIAEVKNSTHENKLEAFSDLLLEAAKGGYIELVTQLIQEGAAVDHTNNIGWTALMERWMDDSGLHFAFPFFRIMQKKMMLQLCSCAPCSRAQLHTSPCSPTS